MKKIVAATLLLLSSSVLSAPLPDFPFVLVSEKMTKQIKPDFVSINFSAVAYDKTSTGAVSKLSDVNQNIRSVMKKLNIDLSKLESTQVEKNAKRANADGNYSLDILGYAVHQTFTLRLSELDKFPYLMNSLIQLDGLENISSRFQLQQADKAKDSMIQELSRKARKKADRLASAQARKVKAVYGITTEGSFEQAFAQFSVNSDIIEKYRYLSLGSQSSIEMLVPEFIEMTQTITAIYQLK
ncbi:MAG: SIMPL domain-containing protein [Parashewanella sp.]